MSLSLSPLEASPLREGEGEVYLEAWEEGGGDKKARQERGVALARELIRQRSVSCV